MTVKKQTSDRMRKIPVQERSQETVKIIFEAAARILERDGPEAFNTNAVAERAGISIGTLYHYFGSKDAILVAMARRELQAHEAAVTRAIVCSLASGGSIRAIVRALIRASGQRLRARRIASDTMTAHGLAAELAGPTQAIMQMLESSGALSNLGVSRPVSPIGLFVLTRAVSGVVSSVVREGSPSLTSPELEDELVKLIEAYLELRTPF
jgi:AcrR family transcriptional regulator